MNYISYCLSSVETNSLVELLLAKGDCQICEQVYHADFVKARVIPLCTVIQVCLHFHS